jgi:FkbM family methyltransferase
MLSRLSKNSLIIERSSNRLHEDMFHYLSSFFASPSQIWSDNDSGFESVDFQAKPKWIRDMLARPNVHDRDYFLLSYLNKENSIILDIGANWGYSAGAFKKIGVKSKIVSFEVIPGFTSVLNELKSVYPESYDYHIVGLGDHEATMPFWCPVVNNFAESALCSADYAPNLKCLTDNILTFIGSASAISGDNLCLQILEFTSQIHRLDNVIPNKLPIDWHALPIEAIKIDVEGLECRVLSGGHDLINRFKPLILAEGGNRTAGIADLMDGYGYIYADNINGVLMKNDGIGSSVNGFFLHRERLSEYQSHGIYEVS